jgi:hypothetical protein
MKVMNVHPYSEEGIPEAGMGVDAADYNADGLLDIFITHLDFELNRLYQNKGAMSFSDVTMLSGLGRTAIMNSGFGTRFFNFDSDGQKDLLVINGHVLDKRSCIDDQQSFLGCFSGIFFPDVFPQVLHRIEFGSEPVEKRFAYPQTGPRLGIDMPQGVCRLKEGSRLRVDNRFAPAHPEAETG